MVLPVALDAGIAQADRHDWDYAQAWPACHALVGKDESGVLGRCQGIGDQGSLGIAVCLLMRPPVNRRKDFCYP